MSNLKQTILSDFTTAFKARDEEKKATLALVKAEITKEEKSNGKELDDAAILKVLLRCAKQRKDSISEYNKANREDLANKELTELRIIELYLPSQMSKEELTEKATAKLGSLSGESNIQKKVGMVMGQFNKEFQGQYDNALLKSILEELVS